MELQRNVSEEYPPSPANVDDMPALPPAPEYTAEGARIKAILMEIDKIENSPQRVAEWIVTCHNNQGVLDNAARRRIWPIGLRQSGVRSAALSYQFEFRELHRDQRKILLEYENRCRAIVADLDHKLAELTASIDDAGPPGCSDPQSALGRRLENETLAAFHLIRIAKFYARQGYEKLRNRLQCYMVAYIVAVGDPELEKKGFILSKQLAKAVADLAILDH